MSIKVVVVCEDHVLDQYILKPLVSAMLTSMGKPNAHVSVVSNARTRGRGVGSLFRDACSILSQYGPVATVVLFVIDRDCDNGTDRSRNKVTKLRRRLGRCERFSEKALVLGAINEVEVWALWGVRTDLGTPWTTIREECHPKEVYFEPLLTAADRLLPDKGRKRLIQASLQTGWNSLQQGCPELAETVQQIRPLLEAG